MISTSKKLVESFVCYQFVVVPTPFVWFCWEQKRFETYGHVLVHMYNTEGSLTSCMQSTSTQFMYSLSRLC